MKKICIFSANDFNKKSGGPQRRYFEFAKSLKKEGHKVSLFSEKLYSAPSNLNNYFFLKKLNAAIKNHDTFILQPDTLFYYYEYLKDKILIVDLICPFHIEHEEILKASKKRNHDENSLLKNMFLFSLKKGDFFLCGNDAQKTYYQKLLDSIHQQSKKQLITILPYGISSSSPKIKPFYEKRCVLSKTNSGFKFLWLGGIWRWYDPLTLLKGFKQLIKKHPDSKLLFLCGLPNNIQNKKAVSICENFIYDNQLTKNVEIIKKNIPFHNLAFFLKNCHAGVISFKSTKEAKLSCRIRYMDLLWGNLPLILSPGDPFGNIINKNNIGIILKNQTPGEWHKALKNMIDINNINKFKNNIKNIKHQFYWNNIMEPLLKFLKKPKKNKKQTFSRPITNLNQKAVIFGTGKAALRTYILCRQKGLTPLFFIDNDKEKWNSYIENLSIYPPEKLKDFQPDIVFIASFPGRNAMEKQLKQLELHSKINVTWFGNI